MLFKQGTAVYSYEVMREAGQNVMYINYLGSSFVPNIAESPEVMARTVDDLIESPNVSRVVFVQQRNYNYDFSQISYLLEIAQLYIYLIKQEKILGYEKLGFSQQFLGKRHESMNYFSVLLKRDPIAAYYEIRRLLREARNELEKINLQYKGDQMAYIRILEKISALLENTRLIKEAMPYLETYKFSDREIYKNFFRPDIIPNFTFTRLVSVLPEDAEIIEQYSIAEGYDKSTVTILKKKNESKYIYHLMPPEYTLDEDFHYLLNLARNVLIEHRPKAEEFTDVERTRQVFFNVSRDLLQELAENKKISLTYSELNKLAGILVRHTIGFGLIEVLLQDSRLQDIVLNAPISLNPIFLRHAEFDECITNIIPSQEDADSWAAKFRMLSGRPLDEANPILDTDLSLGKVRARVAIIQQPLSPHGLAYALRRHREEPWTLPLFVKNKMLNSFSAGLLSFLIDGARTMLVAGSRSSGKTSLLGALMLEIMSKYRIIVVEDSITRDSKIIIKENGKFKKTTIGKLIDEQIKKNGFVDNDSREKALNSQDIKIFSVDKDGKIILAKPSLFIRHETDKQIYEIITTSGKKIKVTKDHSLFTLDEKNIIKAIKSKDIKEGSFIAVPLKLPFDNSLESINLIEHLKKLNKKIFILGEGVEKYMLKNRKEIFSLAYSLGYKKSTIQNWVKKKILPMKIFIKVKDRVEYTNLFIKSYGNSGKIPTNIIFDESLLVFLGLWLADGCYDKRSIIISVQEEENKSIVRKIAERFSIPIKMHSDKFSLMLNSSIFKEIMQNIFEFKGDAYTKKISDWCFNLSDKQIGWLLKGYFSGDGCASDKEVVFASCSRELVEDISTLLLRFSIILRVSEMKEKDKTYNCRIGATKMINRFKENIGFLPNLKLERLNKLCSRISTHDTSDIIPLSLEIKHELAEILGRKFNKNDYILRENNIGREHLANLLNLVPDGITNPIEPLNKIVKSDIFWDSVKSIKEIEAEGYVYDISVPECENFICENVIAHNTLELPADALRKIGYDILRMKVRSALLQTTTEVAAEEGIRTSLRFGDSCLILGEVRSIEARALYEAMRVGALANVVAGTIHGASPYSVFDRVVNDLQVPVTSFKATDCILVANPVKTADGMHSFRRVVQLAEVRKHWTKDPLEEQGFIDLLKYNVDKDELEASAELINGDSEIIKDVASGVKGWVGNWDAVYDNILLRGKIKQEIVNISEKLNMPELLEAKFNSISNTIFHEISDDVRKETGLPISSRVFPLWSDWIKKEVKRIKIYGV